MDDEGASSSLHALKSTIIIKRQTMGISFRICFFKHTVFLFKIIHHSLRCVQLCKIYDLRYQIILIMKEVHPGIHIGISFLLSHLNSIIPLSGKNVKEIKVQNHAKSGKY